MKKLLILYLLLFAFSSNAQNAKNKAENLYASAYDHYQELQSLKENFENAEEPLKPILLEKYSDMLETVYDEINMLIKLDNSSPDVYLLLGRVYGTIGAWEEAVSATKLAIELDDTNPEYQIACGWACFWAGRQLESFMFFHNAIDLDPNSYHAYLGLGIFWVQKSGEKDVALACEYFNKAKSLGGMADEAIQEWCTK